MGVARLPRQGTLMKVVGPRSIENLAGGAFGLGSAAAGYVRHEPAAPLASYIQCFWWSRRVAPQPGNEHILPSGGVQMLFTLHDTPIVCIPDGNSTRQFSWRDSIVHGPQWKSYIAGPKPCGGVAGVAFRPGAAGAILGVPITDLAGDHCTLGMLWGRSGQFLHERLKQAAGPREVFAILERDLRARIQPKLNAHPAVACALQRPLSSRIADAQRESGFSPKHFTALFRAAVGLTPKHYSRLQRFNTVLRCLASGERLNLAACAANAGYSDQAHLTREFREFAGMTPTQYSPSGADSHLHHRASGPFASDSR